MYMFFYWLIVTPAIYEHQIEKDPMKGLSYLKMQVIELCKY